MATPSEPTPKPVGSAPVKKRSTRWRVIKWVLITFGALTLAFVSLVAFVLIQLVGGWPTTTEPKETDPAVVAAIAAGNGQRDKLASNVQAAGDAAGWVRVATTTPGQGCFRGQNDLTRHDGYDLACETKVSVILGATRASEAQQRTQLRALHDQLTASGWESSYEGNTLKSIGKFLDEPKPPGRLGAVPLLDRIGTATYFHGRAGGQGAATIWLRFTADDSHLHQLLGGDGEPAAFRDTLGYLRGRGNYIVSIDLTYTSFYG